FDVYVDPALVSYAVAIATVTREPAAHGVEGLKDFIAYGASPRGPISLVQAARALALVRGRDYVLADDLHALAKDALRHRLSPRAAEIAAWAEANIRGNLPVSPYAPSTVHRLKSSR